MTKTKPLILVTNDDGYRAEGIRILAEAMRELGNVVVFAPENHQSGMSSAISSVHPLRCRMFAGEAGFTGYCCNGTPVDCVKLALNDILELQPDLLVSGINHGSNAGISVIYSGTMGAAIEGCIFNIPSIGFSLCSLDPDADFSTSAQIAKKVASAVLDKKLPKGVCLNVNIPQGAVKGIKVTSQTRGKWVNEYMKAQDGNGGEVYWMTGNFENWEQDNENTDEWALANGYAAVVPVKIDMTAYDFISELKQWNF